MNPYRRAARFPVEELAAEQVSTTCSLDMVSAYVQMWEGVRAIGWRCIKMKFITSKKVTLVFRRG